MVVRELEFKLGTPLGDADVVFLLIFLHLRVRAQSTLGIHDLEVQAVDSVHAGRLAQHAEHRLERMSA